MPTFSLSLRVLGSTPHTRQAVTSNPTTPDRSAEKKILKSQTKNALQIFGLSCVPDNGEYRMWTQVTINFDERRKKLKHKNGDYLIGQHNNGQHASVGFAANLYVTLIGRKYIEQCGERDKKLVFSLLLSALRCGFIVELAFNSTSTTATQNQSTNSISLFGWTRWAFMRFLSFNYTPHKVANKQRTNRVRMLYRHLARP